MNAAVSSLGRAGGPVAPIKACIIRRAKANSWTLPQAWMAQAHRTGVPVATFALVDGGGLSHDPPAANDYVIRKGKVFQAGDYPDKDFVATIEDLVVASYNFVPVDNDLEHMPTILDGKLGTLMNVSLSEDNSELYGEVEIPRWLHETIGDAPIKTSLTWDRDTKSIVGNALVIEPRVSDAAVMSAYTAFAASHPDPVVEHPTLTVPLAAHTHTINDGVDEKGGQKGPDFVLPNAALQSNENAGDVSQLDMPNITNAVTMLSTIKALVTGNDPALAATHPTFSPPASAPVIQAKEDTVTEPVAFKESEEYKAMQAQIAALTAENTARAAREATRDQEVIRERAGVWANAEVAAFRALPAEREALVAAFVDAATDDASLPRQVSFAVGTETKEGSRVDALRARHAARVPHTLTTEQLREATIVMAARPDSTASDTMTPDRKKKLMELHGYAAS